MDAAQILFIIVAAVTIFSALGVVTSRNLVYSALWLILTLFGVAVFYAILSAGFLAVAQVVIYIGAIAILIIFAVMMTRRVMDPEGPRVNSNWWIAVLISVLLLGSLGYMFSQWDGFKTPLPALAISDSVVEMGRALVDPNRFVLPFELASVLLLAALIGSIMIAWEKEKKQP
jgi:NADH-quinone oxidoreductase subunit J